MAKATYPRPAQCDAQSLKARPPPPCTKSTAGARCPVSEQVADRVLSLPMMDGDPDTGFPRDIDGDGMADIRRADDSFLYAFTSYAGSWAPPRLWNLRDGALVDVSAEPRYAKFWRNNATDCSSQSARSAPVRARATTVFGKL